MEVLLPTMIQLVIVLSLVVLIKHLARALAFWLFDLSHIVRYGVALPKGSGSIYER